MERYNCTINMRREIEKRMRRCSCMRGDVVLGQGKGDEKIQMRKQHENQRKREIVEIVLCWFL